MNIWPSINNGQHFCNKRGQPTTSSSFLQAFATTHMSLFTKLAIAVDTFGFAWNLCFHQFDVQVFFAQLCFLASSLIWSQTPFNSNQIHHSSTFYVFARAPISLMVKKGVDKRKEGDLMKVCIVLKIICHIHDENLTKAFESADKNHDGFLSPEEYVRVFRYLHPSSTLSYHQGQDYLEDPHLNCHILWWILSESTVWASAKQKWNSSFRQRFELEHLFWWHRQLQIWIRSLTWWWSWG